MANMEKLFMQIFERKNWIIQHLNQQKQLYDQHLVSKLLIQGIQPPPWLLGPDCPCSGSDLTAFSKEELISGLLLPRPGPLPSCPSGPCFSCDTSVAAAANNERPREVCAKTCASSNGSDKGQPDNVPSCHDDGTEGWPATLPPCNDGGTEDIPNYAPMSPDDQTVTMISNTYSTADQSLARIHRSRSRQKALELRNSAKASAKSRLGKENDSCIHSDDKILKNGQQLDGLRESLELVKPSGSSAKTCSREEAAIGDCSDKERRSDLGCDAHSQSGGNEGKDVETGDNHTDRTSNDFGGQNTRSRSCCPQFNSVDHENSRKSHEVYIGRMTRSRSGKAEQSLVSGDQQKPRKSHDAHVGRMTRCRSGKVEQSDVDDLRVTRSRSYHNQSICGNNAIRNSKAYSGRITRSRICTAEEAETEDHRSRTKNDMSVKPKQLDFDEVGESCSAISLSKGQDKSAGKPISQNLDEKSTSLPCALSSKRTSETYPKLLGRETLEVQGSEIAHSPPSDKNSGQNLPDFLIDSQASEERLPEITGEHAADPSSPGLIIYRETGFISPGHMYRPEGGLSPTEEENDHSSPGITKDGATESISLEHENEPEVGKMLSEGANDFRLIGKDTDANIDLHTEAVEGTECSEKTKHESSSCNDHHRPLDLQSIEIVESSPGRDSTRSLASALKSASPACDEIQHDCEPEMFTVETQSDNAHTQMSCISSHVEASSDSNLLELRAALNVLPEYELSSGMDGSWPGCKRRKIGHVLRNKSAGPSVMMNPFLASNFNNSKKSLSGQKDNLFPISMSCHDSDARVSRLGVAAMVIDQSPECSLSVEPKRALEMQHEEDGVSLERSVMESFMCGNKQPSTSCVSKVKQCVTAEALDCPMEKKVKADPTRALLCTGRKCDDLASAEDVVDDGSMEKLTSAKNAANERQFLQDGDKVSVESPLIVRMDLCVSDADKSGPEFDSFIISENSGSVHNADNVLHGEISYLTNSTGVTSLLEHCEHGSFTTPASPFPTPNKFHLTPGVYRSVPNLRVNQLSDDTTLQGKSYSDCFSFPSIQSGWDIGKPFVSPLGKELQGITSKSGGSDKLSSNPELICFPIQEDPESSEEEVNVENDMGATSAKIIDSTMSCSPIREPLHDITVKNASNLRPSHEVERCSLESVSTQMSVGVMHNNGTKKSEVHRESRQTKRGKENQNLSFGANSIKKQSGSLSSRYSKPKLSGKSSLRSRGQSFSEMEPKRNNIVSNVKSFIPLVQQKQAAAAVPAKRDLKIKALEAAEAAKRLAEKKENERMQKKEALKLERARLEQENLKQIEFKKKLKEEEKKRRDAENVAKKRQREEEERKEKERKRKRIEEARSQQKHAEEKMNAWREELRCGTEDGRAHGRKDSTEKIGNQVDGAKEENTLEKPLNDSVEADAKLPIMNDKKDSTGSSDTGKVGIAETSTPICDKKDQSVDHTSEEQSYDISPYQCSDDEEEEEDDVPNKKFIPKWASKNSMALAVLSQQEFDPDRIFPPGSFCSLEEVLLPRRLLQK